MAHYPLITDLLADAVSKDGDAGQAREQLELFTTAQLRTA
jgi:hypothetical protein